MEIQADLGGLVAPGAPNRLAFTWGWALGGHADTLVSLTLRAVGRNSTLNKLALYVKGERKSRV